MVLNPSFSIFRDAYHTFIPLISKTSPSQEIPWFLPFPFEGFLSARDGESDAKLTIRR
jgi:hypothetical protein